MQSGSFHSEWIKMNSLANKVVIVTGSSSGIGAACVESFSKYGSKVVICGRDQKRMQEVQQKCVQNGASKDNILTVQGDLSDSNCIQHVVDKTVETFGTIHIVVHSAGYSIEAHPSDVECDQIRRVWRIHLTCGYELVQRALTYLKQNKGSVIFMGSMLAFKPVASHTPYCVTKAAEHQLVKLMAAELADYGIRVNSVVPAWVRTNILQSSGVTLGPILDAVSWRLLDSMHPVKRCGKAEEMAEYTAFVTSDLQSHVTGQCLVADGGASLTSSITYNITSRLAESFQRFASAWWRWFKTFLRTK